MKKLITGLHHFQSNIFLSHKELFERLAKEQNPDALFITCSDSRINPNLITHTNPGDLFIIRNAGNIIPPHRVPYGGEQATIEFAVLELGIKDIIVCGHSFCGAIKVLLQPQQPEYLPAMQDWLTNAKDTRHIIENNYAHLDYESQLNVAIQENVLVQLEHLRTHPAVITKIASNELNLHGWVYKIETGDVFAYNPDTYEFLPIMETLPQSKKLPPKMKTTSI